MEVVEVVKLSLLRHRVSLEYLREDKRIHIVAGVYRVGRVSFHRVGVDRSYSYIVYFLNLLVAVVHCVVERLAILFVGRDEMPRVIEAVHLSGEDGELASTEILFGETGRFPIDFSASVSTGAVVSISVDTSVLFGAGVSPQAVDKIKSRVSSAGVMRCFIEASLPNTVI